MDPKQALIDLLECIAARDFDGAREALDNIEEWSGPMRQGFIPTSIHKALDVLRFAD